MKNLVLIIILAVNIFSGNAQDKSVTDEEILKWFDGLRVADVSDGMDAVGLPDVGLMDQEITPLWSDLDNFSHRICGIALTVRYTPTNRIVPTQLSEADFDKWVGEWYSKISPEPFVESIKPGTVLVMDQQGRVDAGTMGSFNGLVWMQKGARGVVASGGIRDIDEVIKEKIPVYMDFDKRGRGIRPGRNEVESFNKPVVVGGVRVNPGDVVVADGDGVIVVPRDKAIAVARYARKILDGDKSGRRDLYKKMNIQEDKSVK